MNAYIGQSTIPHASPPEGGQRGRVYLGKSEAVSACLSPDWMCHWRRSKSPFFGSRRCGPEEILQGREAPTFSWQSHSSLHEWHSLELFLCKDRECLRVTQEKLPWSLLQKFCQLGCEVKFWIKKRMQRHSLDLGKYSPVKTLRGTKSESRSAISSQQLGQDTKRD